MIAHTEHISKIGLFVSLLASLDIESKKSDLQKLQGEIHESNWDDQEKMASLQKKSGGLTKFIEIIEIYKSHIHDLETAWELKDEDEYNEILETLTREYEDLKQQTYLNKPFDQSNALLSVHSGAGGIDAQDFAAILLSMYQAFAKKQDWSVTIISLSSGDEGGIKSAMLEIKGYQAFGLLKEEAGVHRLVRISPFNSGKTRETSFALVEVIPDNVNELIGTIEINQDELKWDYFMSSGKGGQSVNTTYSAVRVKHIPTGITVTCQNERNQQQNKQQALKYLSAKLAALEAKKIDELKQEIRGEFQSIEWGSQIRNYVLHPYKMVKDVRSGWSTSDTSKILEEGDLLPLIWSVKLSDKS